MAEQEPDWKNLARRLTEEAADEVERKRQELKAAVNNTDTAGPELDAKECRRRLEAEHGQVWDSYQLARDFEVEAFASPVVVVIRRCDGRRGTMMYQHIPRFYWGFE